MHPLINKFYQQHKVRGRAKSHDDVWVIKIEKQIVATAKVSPKQGHLLLTGVFTLPAYRSQRLASHLIAHLHSFYSQPIFTFAYSHLVTWYNRNKFKSVEPPTALAILFQAYIRQGRDIQCMVSHQES